MLSATSTEEEGDEVMADVVCSGQQLDESTNRLDRIMVALEGVLANPSFQALQDDFCEAHGKIFTTEEENKVEYMTI